MSPFILVRWARLIALAQNRRLDVRADKLATIGGRHEVSRLQRVGGPCSSSSGGRLYHRGTGSKSIPPDGILEGIH